MEKKENKDISHEYGMDLKTRQRIRRHMFVIKLLSIFLILCMITGYTCLVLSVIDICKNDRTDSCSNQNDTIWLPYKNGDVYYREDTKEEIRLYCKKGHHGVSHLLDLMVTAKYKVTRDGKPHTGCQSSHFTYEDTVGGKILWKKPYDYHRTQRADDSTGWKIEKNGVYSVYSMVTFHHEHTHGAISNEHGIITKRKGEVKHLLDRNIQTLKPTEKELYQTSDLIGNFYLRQGDIIYPWVSNVSALYKSTPTNFWGFYHVRQ